MINVTPLILCGGSGTRLWPLSRTGFPKQFLNLLGENSLFQQVASRLSSIGNAEIHVDPSFIVCGEEHRFLVLDQLSKVNVPIGSAVLEPVARNTAPALTLAAFQAMSDGLDPILVVAPADQAVGDELKFKNAIQEAINEAASGSIVILGIPPDRPETGFGYIESVKSDKTNINSVLRFIEKPDLIKAQQFFESGNYFWNAGIFVIKASVWLKAIETFRNDIFIATQEAWMERKLDGLFVRPDPSKFNLVPSDSIDYAVIEKCPGTEFQVRMITLDAGWSDLGAWDAVWKAMDKDTNGNATIGDSIVIDSRNSLVHSNHKLVALVGLDDVVVVETADAVLVLNKKLSQGVKEVVENIKKSNRDEHILHRKVNRPWGWYDSIDEGGRFKVKRIQVKPKASLSLQMHHHRAEHWIVVQGTAEITNGKQTLILSENQSTYIPLGEVHRLANPGSIPLEIIEVQSGSYLGEDDIVRFEDSYGRS
jgi:mannose-1-phosphate guanylyltransferase/mannose-6-phosphate isomerase